MKQTRRLMLLPCVLLANPTAARSSPDSSRRRSRLRRPGVSRGDIFPRNTRMFYYLTQESINSPDKLVKIKSSNYELNEAQPANNYSFAVYGNNYPHDYGYFIQTTNYVQEYGGQNNP